MGAYRKFYEKSSVQGIGLTRVEVCLNSRFITPFSSCHCYILISEAIITIPGRYHPTTNKNSWTLDQVLRILPDSYDVIIYPAWINTASGELFRAS